MAYRLLRREGWLVNHKRVHRLWREEGLQRPTPRKQKRARPDVTSCIGPGAMRVGGYAAAG
jgi:transposase InsO family protein